MKFYIDSSVVLRLVFGESNPIKMPKDLEYTVSSELLRVECLRTVDRMKHMNQLSNKEVSERSALLYKAMHTLRFIKMSEKILMRAAEPFSTTIGTLDALHLSTAIAWRDQVGKNMVFLTHDEQLGLAAISMDFVVQGLEAAY